MSRKSRSALATIGFHCFVLLSSLLMIYPILWLAASSLKSPSEIWLKIYSLIPESPSLDSYFRGWKGFGGISFTTFYVNSTLFATLGTLFAIVSSAFIAFGFARIDFKGKGFFFACMLVTLMIPTQIQIIPQYIIFSKMRWVNTYLPLIVPRLFGQAFFIFMFVQFMRGVPRELDEAVAIDGGGRITVFGKVMLPLMKPALFTGSIFSFYWTWNEFFTPLVYLNKPRQYTLSLALRSFSDPSGLTDWGAIFAMSFLSLVPVFFLFIAFQRYLVEGIATTGIKG